MKRNEKFYRKIIEIRHFERKLYESIKGSDLARYIHLSVGREPVAAAVGLEFIPGDAMVSTYRTHGISLALGISPTELLAEILAVKNSHSEGFSGSIHIESRENGIYDSNGIIAGGIPIATGLGMYRKIEMENRIAWCFFGDGAVQAGSFHESLNIAARHQLPVIFICENNGLGMTTTFESVAAVNHVVDYANVYQIKGVQLDVNHLEGFLDEFASLVQQVRNGQGPALVEINIPPICPHSAADEMDFTQIDQNIDPIHLYTEFYSKTKELGDVQQIKLEVEQQIDQISFTWYPDQRPIVPLYHRDGESTFRQAIQETIEDLMAEDQRIMMLGTALERTPFFKRFGPERVKSMPIAENSVVGIAHGLALDGKKPIMDIMMAGFTYVAADQIINQLAMGQFYRNQVPAPNVLIRALIGSGEAMGAQHSQNPHGMFLHVPGLTILYPAFPEDASGVLRAVQDVDGPVLFFEHILLRNVQGNKSQEPYPIGKLSVKRQGTDITFVAAGAMVHVCLETANMLEETDIDAEVLDLVTIAPLDLDGIYESIEKTGRLIVVDEAWPYAGLADHIVAQLTINRFTHLKVPPAVLTLPAMGLPSSKELILELIPSVEKLRDLTNKIIKGD